MFGCVCFSHVPKVKRDKLDKKAVPGIFVGYSSFSKAYKVYHPQTKNMTITRDVHCNEDQQWDWKNSQRTCGSLTKIEDNHLEEPSTGLCWSELEDDPPIRGTRLLSNIYQRCNVAICEPVCCEDALKDPKWKNAIEEEMSMIQKKHGSWLKNLKIKR